MTEENVLLVDSELLTRDLLGNHLKHLGMNVLAVENSVAARKLVPGSRFRLALLSEKVGDKGLQEIIACLREHEIDSLVILLTTQIRDTAYLESRQLFDTIVKPFRLEDVRLKLSHAVEIVSLRRALRASAEKLKKLEKELAAYETAAEEVAIPDLSALEDETGAAAGSRKVDRPAPDAGKGMAEGMEQDDDLFDKIRKLDILRKAGILTPVEFTRKKKELLDRI
jgi:DNA-binding response OmpR family regulator